VIDIRRTVFQEAREELPPILERREIPDERQGWRMSIAPNTPLGATNPACSPDGSGAVIAAVAEPPVPRVPGHPDHGHRQEKALAPEEEPRWRCK